MILFSTIVASLYIFLEFLYFLSNHFCNLCIAQSRKYTLSNHVLPTETIYNIKEMNIIKTMQPISYM